MSPCFYLPLAPRGALVREWRIEVLWGRFPRLSRLSFSSACCLSMQAVHPMFGPDEMSSTLVSSFTPAERRMHSSPAARQPIPWRTMLSAGLFVSGACVGYAMAVFQHTQYTLVPTVPTVLLVEQKVEPFYAGTPPAITSRRRGGTAEGGATEGVDAPSSAEAASGCCGPC